ncbi:MAG TPA: sulfate ABC transporter substrate-binding protein [Ignavibacteriaceae bacterium]|nr:sulfate ABC transporter substrate-binding protein [Ignavibacteriaceae bacterium]
MITSRILSALFFTALLIYTLWPWLTGSARDNRTIVLYGFSILEEVMNKGIFPAFKSEWKDSTGETLSFTSSFGGSGTITNQIIMGVPAEIAILSLELDAMRLLDNKVLKDSSWKKLPNKGIVNTTPFIFLVRPGNPKGVKDFSDLTRKGIGIVHPDPLTSGGAQWAILAEYGSVSLTGDKESAYSQLLGIWKNVIAQAASARAARTQFNNGFGDVLITYEQEALVDKAKGKLKAEIIYPVSTILSEHVVVEITKNISEDQKRLVDAFIKFLWSDKAQKIFVEYGFRSFNEKFNINPDFGKIQKPFYVKDLGGWSEAKKEIVEKIWKKKVLKEVHK